MYETVEPEPLFCSAVLTMLAVAIVGGAFALYNTAEELLEIEPSDDEMYTVRIKGSMLDRPFFQVQFTGKSKKPILSASGSKI